MNHLLVQRFLSMYELLKWVQDGFLEPSSELRHNQITRGIVDFRDPMVQLAIQYEYWPIKVASNDDGAYFLIRDASGEFTG